jgi:hypothetical protein
MATSKGSTNGDQYAQPKGFKGMRKFSQTTKAPKTKGGSKFGNVGGKVTPGKDSP